MVVAPFQKFVLCKMSLFGSITVGSSFSTPFVLAYFPHVAHHHVVGQLVVLAPSPDRVTFSRVSRCNHALAPFTFWTPLASFSGIQLNPMFETGRVREVRFYVAVLSFLGGGWWGGGGIGHGLSCGQWQANMKKQRRSMLPIQ